MTPHFNLTQPQIEFCKAFRKWRLSTGITASFIAKKSGFSRDVIASMEHGRTVIYKSRLESILVAFEKILTVAQVHELKNLISICQPDSRKLPPPPIQKSFAVNVPASWDELRLQIYCACQLEGSRTSLKELLQVSDSELSHWLSCSKNQRQPRADIALKMLQWLIAK